MAHKILALENNVSNMAYNISDLINSKICRY